MSDTLKKICIVLIAVICLGSIACCGDIAADTDNVLTMSVPGDISAADSENTVSDTSYTEDMYSSAASSSARRDINSGEDGISGVSESVTDENIGFFPGAADAEISGSSETGVSESGSAFSVPIADTAEITVSVTVDCTDALEKLPDCDFLPDDGIMVRDSVIMEKGISVFDAVAAVCADNGIALNYTGSPGRRNVYIRGIGGLGEKDCGGQSGWKYSVDGITPGRGMSAYILNDSADIRIYYAMS